MKKIFILQKRIVEVVSHNSIYLAIASFIWLLFRTGTKPSRINYPCQQTALANAGLLIYLLPAFHIKRFKQFLQAYNKRVLLGKSALIIFGTLAVIFVTNALIKEGAVYRYWRLAAKEAKGPIGIKTPAGFQTIPAANRLDSPHRVVSIHDSRASTWTGDGNPHTTLNQTAITEMVDRGVMALTGKPTAIESWEFLIPYETGQAVAIKLNFNNTSSGDWYSDPYMNPYAELVNAIIESLVSIGVPSEKIWLTDPSRLINIPFQNRITNQGVRFYTHKISGLPGGIERVLYTDYVNDSSPYSTLSNYPAEWINPAQVFVDADHIINVPQLKGHSGTSITLGLKNHFGSVSFTADALGFHPLHSFFYIDGSDYSGTEHNLLADINDNPVFKDKTRLIIGDGLMGNSTVNYQPPHIWASFGGHPPETLFFGVDPVAVDSVMTDFLNRENHARGEYGRNDDILVYAANLGLGVFEHWDDPTTRIYAGIDYREIDVDGLSENIPLAPEILTAIASSRSIKLTWSDNSDNEDGFYLERSTLSDFSDPTLIKIGANITIYNDISLIESTMYYYRILAQNVAGASPWSAVYNVQTEASTPLAIDYADLEVTAGQALNIVIKASNGEGLTVSLEFYEVDDNLRSLLSDRAYGLPINGIISNGLIRIAWPSVWFNDEDGADSDPELQFVAICGTSSFTSQIVKINKP